MRPSSGSEPPSDPRPVPEIPNYLSDEARMRVTSDSRAGLLTDPTSVPWMSCAQCPSVNGLSSRTSRTGPDRCELRATSATPVALATPSLENPGDAAVDGLPGYCSHSGKQIVSRAECACRIIADLKRAYFREPSPSSLRGKRTGTISQRKDSVDHGLHSPYHRYSQRLRATLTRYQSPAQRRPSDGEQNVFPIPQIPSALACSNALPLHRKVVHESRCVDAGKSSGHCRE